MMHGQTQIKLIMNSGVAKRIFESGARWRRALASGALLERTLVHNKQEPEWATKPVWRFGEEQTLLTLPRINPVFSFFLPIA